MSRIAASIPRAEVSSTRGSEHFGHLPGAFNAALPIPWRLHEDSVSSTGRPQQLPRLFPQFSFSLLNEFNRGLWAQRTPHAGGHHPLPCPCRYAGGQPPLPCTDMAGEAHVPCRSAPGQTTNDSIRAYARAHIHALVRHLFEGSPDPPWCGSGRRPAAHLSGSPHPIGPFRAHALYGLHPRGPLEPPRQEKTRWCYSPRRLLSCPGSMNTVLAGQILQHAQGCLQEKRDSARHSKREEAFSVLEQGLGFAAGSGSEANALTTRLLLASASAHLYFKGDAATALETLRGVPASEYLSFPSALAVAEGMLFLEAFSAKKGLGENVAKMQKMATELLDRSGSEKEATEHSSKTGDDQVGSRPWDVEDETGLLRMRALGLKLMIEQYSGTKTDNEHLAAGSIGLEPELSMALPLITLAQSLTLGNTMPHQAPDPSSDVRCEGLYTMAEQSTEDEGSGGVTKEGVTQEGVSKKGVLISVFDIHSFAPVFFAPQHLRAAASCGKAQLMLDKGDFGEADKLLTKALHDAEYLQGLTAGPPQQHGPTAADIPLCVVLTLTGRMLGERGRKEHSGEGVLAEGLFRRSLGLLHSGALQSLEEQQHPHPGSQLEALTCVEYAQVLDLFQGRATEAARMRNYAKSCWPGIAGLAGKRFVVDLLTGRVLHR